MKTITINKKIIFILFLILAASQFNFGQAAQTQDNDRKILLKIKNADRSEFRYIPKEPGHYTKEEWLKVIDSTWGEGLPTAKKLQLFDRFWNDVDAKYPSFFNLNVNWDSLKSVYRPEIEAGVSRGRFAAIMDRLSLALSDIHTFIIDLPVSTDSLKPGTPLFVVSGYQSMNERQGFSQEYCHFGASLSPLPDSSLLVYDVVPNHPLGLERGDIVLGYDGIPWKRLYKELLNDELPFRFNLYENGSNPKSINYLLLTSAGENWHLFDTIDIVKYKSGDTLHLPTSLLQDKKMKLLTTSQLPIPGVPFPDIEHGHWVSWGVIDGTNMGYIYVWNWTISGDYPYPTTSTGDDFRNAIDTLINGYKITGLIIDSRYNTGGEFDQYPEGISILFNEDQDIYRWFIRNNADDHYSMTANYMYPLNIKTNRYLFDRPIAVLTGPYSISCGDYMPLQMRYHPMVRIFGLGTNGAFGSIASVNLGGTYLDWMYCLTTSNAKLKDDPSKYLTHLNIPPDEKVWFTQESVAQEEDDVVNAALNWMNNLVYGHSLTKNTVYCRPGVDTLKISALIENPNSHQTSSKVHIKNLESGFLDSLQLTKSGLSGNSEIWTGNYLTPDSEDFFSISLSAKDITDSKIWTTPNISRFTTAGPVVVDSVSFKKIGNLYYFRPFVKNQGKTVTIKNGKMNVLCNDPWVTNITGVNLLDIPPDSTVGSSSWGVIHYTDSLFNNTLNLKFEIMSDGWIYWTDSMQVKTTPAVAVNEQINQPLTYKIEQNYPNPFNPTTSIQYSIANRQFVQLKIFNILGQEIKTLVNAEKPAGNYQVEFNAANLSSGIYFYRIRAGSFNQVRKMILMK